jgi:hypothetical protein
VTISSRFRNDSCAVSNRCADQMMSRESNRYSLARAMPSNMKVLMFCRDAISAASSAAQDPSAASDMRASTTSSCSASKTRPKVAAKSTTSPPALETRSGIHRCAGWTRSGGFVSRLEDAGLAGVETRGAHGCAEHLR